MYKLLLSFISGLTISFISFSVLPFAFSLTGVYLSSVFIILGIIFSNFTEYKLKLNNINIFILNITLSLLVIVISFYYYANGVLLSFCGGSVLYAATYCISPKPSKEFRYKLLSYSGSLLGVFVGILISM